MASDPDITPQPAMQPGLRSFIIYDRVPEGCFSYEVQDEHNLPHLHRGEFVIVDPWDRDPVPGELSLIKWRSSPEDCFNIVTMSLREGTYGDGNGKFWRRSLWWIGPSAKRQLVNARGETVGKPIQWADGPYEDDYAYGITIGKIIGIYQPDFRARLAPQ